MVEQSGSWEHPQILAMDRKLKAVTLLSGLPFFAGLCQDVSEKGPKECLAFRQGEGKQRCYAFRQQLSLEMFSTKESIVSGRCPSGLRCFMCALYEDDEPIFSKGSMELDVQEQSEIIACCALSESVNNSVLETKACAVRQLLAKAPCLGLEVDEDTQDFESVFSTDGALFHEINGKQWLGRIGSFIIRNFGACFAFIRLTGESAPFAALRELYRLSSGSGSLLARSSLADLAFDSWSSVYSSPSGFDRDLSFSPVVTQAVDASVFERLGAPLPYFDGDGQLHCQLDGQEQMRSFPLFGAEGGIGLVCVVFPNKKAQKHSKEQGLGVFVHRLSGVIYRLAKHVVGQDLSSILTVLFSGARDLLSAKGSLEVQDIAAKLFLRTGGFEEVVLYDYDKSSGTFSFLEQSAELLSNKQVFLNLKISLQRLNQLLPNEWSRGVPVYLPDQVADDPFVELREAVDHRRIVFIRVGSDSSLTGMVMCICPRGEIELSSIKIWSLGLAAGSVSCAAKIASQRNEAERTIRIQKAIESVSKSVSSETKIQDIMSHVVRSLRNFFNLYKVCVCVESDVKGIPHFRSSHGIPYALRLEFMQEYARISKMEEPSKVLLYRADESSPEEHDLASALKDSNFSSVVIFPIHGQVENCRTHVAVIAIFSGVGLELKQNEIDYASMLVDIFAPALVKAYIFNSMVAKLAISKRLLDISSVLSSSFSKQNVYETLVRGIEDATDADVCVIRQMTANGRCLELKAFSGRANLYSLPKYVNLNVSDVNSMAYINVVKRGAPVILMGGNTDGRDELFPSWVKSVGACTFMLVPVMLKKEVVGVVGICHCHLGANVAADRLLLESLSGFAGLAIEKSILFDEKQHLSEALIDVLVPSKKYKYLNLEVGVFFRPYMEVSGDYYDVLQITPTKYNVTIADVRAKGVSAAMDAMSLKTLVRCFAFENLQPREILSKVNNSMCREACLRNCTELELTATVYNLEFDLDARVVRCARAGHEPLIYWSKDSEPEFLTVSGTLLGALENASFDQVELTIETGMRVLLYTDGISEAMDKYYNCFDDDNIMDFVKAYCCHGEEVTCEQIVDELHRRAESFSSGVYRDDATIVCIGVKD